MKPYDFFEYWQEVYDIAIIFKFKSIAKNALDNFHELKEQRRKLLSVKVPSLIYNISKELQLKQEYRIHKMKRSEPKEQEGSLSDELLRQRTPVLTWNAEKHEFDLEMK